MHKDSIASMMMERIENGSRDSVYIAADFLDLGEYHAVRQALLRLEKAKMIQKIMRGMYYYPRYSELIQEYEAPSPNKVAEAIARKFNWTIAPSGDTALNMLGLSTQVPANWSYISDGPYHQFQIGNLSIEFKHRNNREISGKSLQTATIIQALKAIGKDNVNESQYDMIRRRLSEDDRTLILNESQQSSMWIYNSIKKICA